MQPVAMAIWLSAGPIDRRAEHRVDPDALAGYVQDPRARVIPVVGTDNLVVADGEALQAGRVPLAEYPFDPDSLVFLGVWGDAPIFAAPLPQDSDVGSMPGELKDLRRAGPGLARDDAAVLAYARSMAHWHNTHRFCGVCGSPTRLLEGGHKRQCTNPDCGASHFPRTDAAMIALVHDGADRCLLARSPRFPPNMYSALAGFLEPGESLEDCVRREVFEEVGVQVTDVRYHQSQPWPFPQSIMIGFHARATETELTLDALEIEDARWVTRDFLRDKSQWQDFFIPPRIAVARSLIDAWLAGEVT